jgi:tetratricopeptide (TPR) repeat protein
MSAESIVQWSWKRGAAALACVFLIACQEGAKPDTDTVLEEARSLIGDRQFAEGIAKMRGLVDANPDDARLQMLYGEALIASGQPSLAVWPLARAMRSPEYLVHSGLLLARAQRDTGSGIDAIQTATRVLEVDPDNEEAILLRAQAHLGESLEDRALEDLDLAEKLGSDKAMLDLLRLDALLGLGREEDAEKLLAELTVEAEAMRDDEPDKAARLCAATATFTYERGRIEEAKKRFDECLEGDGFLHWTLVQAATDFFDKHGELERTTELLKRRFDHDPKLLEARVMYADRLQRVGRLDEAEALLLEATEEQKAAWMALADLYAIAGDVRKALGALDKAIEASPEPPEDWLFSRADFLLALGEVDQAEKAVEAIEIPAHRALLKARIAMARGRLDEAIREFEEGIRLWPDNPDARYLAARVYERKGDWKQAAAHYREAARMDPPHYASSLALAELQRALGDMEGVSFLLLRLGDKHPNDAKVIEKLIEHAGDTGNAELGLRMMTHLSRLRGQAPHAVALAAKRMELAEGPEAALAAIDKTGLDVLEPANVEALEARCRLLIALDREADASQAIERALEKAPDSARLFVLRAFMHREAGRIEPARADLEQARRIDPEHLPAVLELASLEAGEGHPDAARALYGQASELAAAQSKPDEPGDFAAALALARLEIEAGEVDAARVRLQKILDENPREGAAAWLLLKSYGLDTGGGDLDEKAREDLALRAAVFERSAEARDYWNRLKPKAS